MKKCKDKKVSTKLSRRECVNKFARYTAVTALGTFILLNPKKAQDSSPIEPGKGF